MLGVRRRLGAERGQILPLLGVGLLLALLGIAALVVSYGKALTVKSQLQAAADAAALAGAQVLPNASQARTVATNFGATGANVPKNVKGAVTESISTLCSDGASPCSGTSVDTLKVTEVATVDTSFMSVLSSALGTRQVSVSATACGPCTRAPLDIMVVLDRTLSMCVDDSGMMEMPRLILPPPRGDERPSYLSFHWNAPYGYYVQADGNLQLNASPSDCSDYQSARNAINAFLDKLDPTKDHVGLAVTPPPLHSGECTSTQSLVTNEESGVYPSGSERNYTLVSPTSNFAAVRNSLSTCVQVGGSTAYAWALDSAQSTLAAQPQRPNLKRYIVFMSDGGANSADAAAYSDATKGAYITTPCQQGITSARAAMAANTTIYTIGFDVDSGGYDTDRTCFQAPHGSVGFLSELECVGGNCSKHMVARDALKGIASPELDPVTGTPMYDADGTPRTYYYDGTPDNLSIVFRQIAQSMITHARLVPASAR